MSSSDLRRLIRREIAARVGGTPSNATLQNVVTSPTPAGRYGEPTCVVWYRASSGNLPTAAAEGWAAHLTADATATLAAGVLTLEAPSSSDALFYTYDLTGQLDTSKGTYVDALLLPSVGVGVNVGACLAIADGAWYALAWLRPTGCNIDGCADVPLDLSDAAHRVTLVLRGTDVRLHVDGAEVQTGGPAGAATAETVAFGTWCNSSLT